MATENDFIQLPPVEDIQTILTMGRKDIAAEIKDNSELKEPGTFIVKVMDILDQKVAKKDLAKVSFQEKVDIAAHLNFLHTLLEDFFLGDEDYFDEYEDEEMDFEEEEEESHER